MKKAARVMAATTIYGAACRLNAAVKAREMTLAEAVAELLATYQLTPASAEAMVKDPSRADRQRSGSTWIPSVNGPSQ